MSRVSANFTLMVILLSTVHNMVPAFAGWRRRRRAPAPAPDRRRAPVVVCNDEPQQVTVDTTECKSVTKERTAYKQVKKYKTSFRTVTKYDIANRTVNQSKIVEYVLPVENFYHPALQVIMLDISETLRDGIPANVENSFTTTCDEPHEQANEAVIMWGRTQAGKSTMACQLRMLDAEPCPEIGDGGGDSVTETTDLRKSKVGLLLDTPGIDDTKLRFTKEEAGRRVAVGVAAANVTRVKFLVFDSMGNDGMQLRDTLASLQTTFGARAQEAVVVVASKVNLKSGSAGTKRLDLLRKVMEEQGLHELVAWPGPHLDEGGLLELKNALSRVQSIATSELEDLWQRQRKLAQEMYDEQEPRTKTIFVEVEEQYTEERNEQEPFEESYMEQEPFIEKYESVDCYPISKTSTVMARKCHTV